ncbi:AMFR protein [Aspergillus ellipticus CBS 707.79]|uniref:Coupling of ubiquitin conjugation to ER degradation protein 1 n=1 Tax=Aspergillus ellipticus CBS 707.79 TaxID=1448320 RepID=A0A319CTB4_9EURO|nr:AMFR protein [Aspergillus ellipticus CBS 707.79]
MPDEEPSLNIPSLLTLAVVSFFVLRWFLNRDGDAGPGSGRSRTRGGVDPAQVEQIAQMFPQLSHREIMWDLQRNGGNVAATTERILTGRGLEVPPPSFQPQIAIPATAPVQSTRAPATKVDGQDLISRYNLRSQVDADADASPEPAQSPTPPTGWSQSKEERQRLLQKRRDEMILAARRKMMQKEQQAAK